MDSHCHFLCKPQGREREMLKKNGSRVASQFLKLVGKKEERLGFVFPSPMAHHFQDPNHQLDPESCLGSETMEDDGSSRSPRKLFPYASANSIISCSPIQTFTTSNSQAISVATPALASCTLFLHTDPTSQSIMPSLTNN